MDDVLRSDEAAGVLMLTLSRPLARNALDLPLVDALQKALDVAKSTDRIRAIILTGAPPAFCAGMDLNAFAAADAPRHRVTDLLAALPATGKPLIAAVNGAAFTGGLELVLACDFAIAAESARFADTHAKIGALSGSGMGSRLPRAVGARWARQMMLTELAIDAATALRIGLVNEVVADDALVARAQTLARAIATHDPDLLSLAKSVIDRGALGTLADAIRIERETLAARRAAGPMTWKR